VTSPNIFTMRASKHTSHGAEEDPGKEVFGYVRDDNNGVPSAKESSTPSSAQEPPVGFGSLLHQWWTESLWPGMGLFGESYLIFSIGTLTPLWKELYPDCWHNQNGEDVSSEDDYYAYETGSGWSNTCSPRLLESLTYGVVLGVISGMILLGYWSNHIGRRKGSIVTASFMAGGSLGLFTVSVFGAKQWSAERIFGGTVGCLILFGIGVGGEYPLSASLASEKAMEESARNQKLLAEKEKNHGREAATGTTEDRHPRNNGGRRVQLVFAMQGMGIWFNSLTMLVLLWALTGQSNKGEYDDHALVTVWRVTYGIGALVLSFVLLTRILYLEESKVWLGSNTARSSIHESDFSASSDGNTISNDSGAEPTGILEQPKNKIRLVHRQYGSRMFGAGMAWLLWDISFYGNKLFQSTFLLALVGETSSLTELTGAAALNATVALMGYYGAAVLIDLPPQKWRFLGKRITLQSIGLVLTGVLFFACGLLASSSSSKGITVALYLVSSLVGQLGPNCTTFLIPAEIVPTDQRTYCHGVCAASGKIGALIAAVVFHFVGSDSNNNNGEFLFYLCGCAGVLGAVVTLVFVPETAGLDLLELDLQWKLLLVGEGEGKVCYDGPAVHDHHLSLYERYRIRRTRTRQPGDITESGNEPLGVYFS
jgi:MFS family permease